jgi:hypothetical protein
VNFWRIYEKGFPEGPNMKAPGGFRFSLWSLFIPELGSLVDLIMGKQERLVRQEVLYEEVAFL